MRFLTAALVAALAAPALVLPQTEPAPPAPPASAAQDSTVPAKASAVIRTETRLVLVDTVVTDKKGKYVRDLTQKDFKVFEDNKEQPVVNFSSGTDATVQANAVRRYLILFFDNSTMDTPDQIQARSAAAKFIDANAGPDHLMAVVDFGGALRIVQNFTANAATLQAAVSGVKGSAVDPNATAPVTVASTGISSLSTAEADFGARSMLLAVRSLAKNLRSVPGRKMLVLFSGGFPLTAESESELTATIDACNKANVAIYALDARGLVATAPGPPGGSARNRDASSGEQNALNVSQRQPSARTSATARLVLAAYPAAVPGDPQRPGGGGGGGGTGWRRPRRHGRHGRHRWNRGRPRRHRRHGRHWRYWWTRWYRRDGRRERRPHRTAEL